MLEYFFLMEKNSTNKYLQKRLVITHMYKVTEKLFLKGISIGI